MNSSLTSKSNLDLCRQQSLVVWQVAISVNDVDLDPYEHAHVDKQQLGFYVSLGQKLHDVLVLSSGQNTVKVLLPQDTPEKVVIVVKSLGRDEFKVGSISIAQEIFVASGEGKYKQWVTLFDHLDDDEYDGDMGENDDEPPRVQFTFQVSQESVAKPKPLQTPQPTQSKGKTNYNSNGSQMIKDSSSSTASLNSQKKPTQVIESQKSQQPPMTTVVKKSKYQQVTSSAIPTASSSIVNQPSKSTSQISEYSTPVISSTKALQQQTHKEVTPTKLSPIKTHYTDEFDLLREISKEPTKRYKLDFLQKMLDQKLVCLIKSISEHQQENQEIENDVLQRLNMLKTLNTEIETSYKEQNQQVNKIQGIYTSLVNTHKHEIDNDTTKSQLEVKFNELEKTFSNLKVEVEQTAHQNVKLRLSKDERLSSELNKRIFVERKQNDQLREQMKEIEDKRQNQKDQERDYNRDIYQLAKDFKRKVEEYRTLLTNYANERNALLLEIQSANNNIVTAKATSEIEAQKGSKDKECIVIHQQQIKTLEQQIEEKKRQGEEIYNQMRDQVSFQEERIKQNKDEIARLKGNHIQKLEQEQNDHEHDIQRLQEALKDKVDTALIKQCEQELERATLKRDKTRQELESIRKRLEVVVDVQIFEADFEEIEILSEQIKQKDKELLLVAMKAKDNAKQQWLKNWVNIEVHELMRTDRDDIRNHIEMYSDDLSKLSKIIQKFQQLQLKQQEQYHQEEQELKILENEMLLLNEERTECEKELKKLDQEYQSKKVELAQKQKEVEHKSRKIDETEQQIEYKQVEIDKLTEILDTKDSILAELDQKIKKTGAAGIAASLYNAIKGDLVDELLAKYINLTQCPVPIKRLGNGYYLFGSKKIFAKIMNGKLVIRVGGGFMVIEEFIAAYADAEVKKMLAAENAGQEVDDLSGKAKGYGSNRKSPRAGIPSASPRDAFAKKVSSIK